MSTAIACRKERVQRLGVPSAALRAKFYSKTCTWANNVLCCEAVAACKVERGVTRCGDVNTLRAELLLVYFRLGRLQRVSTYVQHV